MLQLDLVLLKGSVANACNFIASNKLISLSMHIFMFLAIVVIKTGIAKESMPQGTSL